MPYFKRDGHDLYYEVHGTKQPLLLLNGIMMSTASWAPLLASLTEDFQVILVDFPDQGKSYRKEGLYDQEDHLADLIGLLDHLSVSACHVLGISYGGEVAQLLAASYGQRVNKLVLANTTAYTTKQLKDIGDGWVYAARTHDASVFFKTAMPLIYSRSFYETHYAWLQEREEAFHDLLTPSWYEGFIRLVQSAEAFDCRGSLKEITCPSLILSGDEDILTPLALQEELVKGITDSQHYVLTTCGHASMYEAEDEFLAQVKKFLK